ncbi:uncharacterized protein N7458_007435 [Penicillium daleae]|uniref:Uncharacterized protein n=1 Tax=Penicillium daleae TaxID=63821 RepID=A0AAD6G0U7_9EURO|nr:uncharacterized protein N7458_007435 [Penicillium daleae]KAJ5443563.1 hypothetical protein N7458_007435 [Penicillium daleae]
MYLRTTRVRVIVAILPSRLLDVVNPHGGRSGLIAVINVAEGVVRARGQSVDTVAAKGVDAAVDARPDEVLIAHEVAREGSEECACGVVGAIEQVYCVMAWKGTVL